MKIIGCWKYESMRTITSRWVLALATAFIMTALILLPEIIFSPSALARDIQNKEYFILFGVCILICTCGRPRFAASIVSILGFMVLTEIGHYMYFGRMLSPIAVRLMFQEWAEIINTGLSLSPYIFGSFLVIVLCYGVIIAMVFKLQGYLPSLPKIGVPALILLMILPAVLVSLRSDKLFFADRSHYPIVIRAIFAYSIGLESWFLAGKCDAVIHQIPSLKMKQPPARDVIILMGESLSASHMSVLGYERKTTPWLDGQHSNSLVGFKAVSAISAGVSTRGALPLFFNVVNNPVDRIAIAKGATNLFRLAQANGFDATFITSQNENVMQGVDLSGVRVIDVQKWKKIWEKKGDLGLIDMLDRVPASSHRFIVIQFRAPHSPYSAYIKNRPDLHRFTSSDNNSRGAEVDSYDSAVLLVDEVVQGIVEHLKVRENSSYLIMTSDHAELLGDKGRWGHSLLDIDVAHVPLILIAPKSDRHFWKWANANSIYSHYQIAREVAFLLGVTMAEQADDKNLFLNGASPFGADGYLKWRELNGQAVEVGRAVSECSEMQHVNLKSIY